MSLLPHRHFLDLGFAMVIPVMPADGTAAPDSTLSIGNRGAGKTPAYRADDGLWWGLKDWLLRTSAPADLDRYAAMGASVGIRTGLQPDGNTLVAIDADATDPAVAALIRACIGRHFASLPCRVGRAPKALYPIRIRGGFVYRRIEYGKAKPFDRVELLSDKRQMVVEGLHPRTMQLYRWTTPLVRYDDLPLVDEAAVVAFLAELETLLPDVQRVKKDGDADTAPAQASLRGKLEHVRDAMVALPNTTALFPDRESYLNVGYALKAALPDDRDEGLTLYLDWCARWDSGDAGEVNDLEVAESDWRRMSGPFRLGASWIYDQAERHSDGAWSRAQVHFETPEAGERLFGFSDDGDSRAASAARFIFKSFGEAADRALTDPSPFLVKGLLDLGAMSVVYGDSNAGKTFVIMDLEHCVATGRPYAGKRVFQGHVLHIFTEGARGGRKRAEALRRACGPASDFHFLFGTVDLFDPAADIAPLLDAIRASGLRFVLIVVDTVARAMAGGDENLAKDMSAFVRNVDRLRIQTGAHTMLIHHTGKDAARGARGSSALRAATDTEIEIAPGQITVTKQRDLDKSWSSTFTLRVVELGRDEDGDVITSCTVSLGAEPSTDADGVIAGTLAEVEEAREIRRLIALLRAVESEPKASVRRLGELAVIPKSTVGKMLDRLKRDRLVSPILGTWELTPKGVKYLADAT
ncbi:hypothetical protein D3273_25350 [Lichenibacterium minor]|uniref:Primase C-terminal 2 domain-containing protein n=1 Tax=Lichenibacterium minor TaxID=2316528 RepID=A0A4V1RTX7_9HYPH|nr:AAA family ATPase [Lichenibacterium minor]RYC29194.1 hypothetical protein D3273_25350 [Lichenibacterium minor]